MKFIFLKRTVLAFFICVIMVLWGASAYLIYSSRVEHLNRARIDSENLADALGAYTELSFGSIANRLKNTAKRFPAGSSFTPLDPEITKLLGESAVATKGMSSLNIFSDDGLVIQSGIITNSGDVIAPKSLINLSERPYFRHFADNWNVTRLDEMFIGNPVKAAVTGRWTVPIAYPRASQGDKFPGIIVTTLQIQNFMEFFANSKLDQDQTVAIAHTNGVMLVRLPRFKGIIGKSFSHGVLYTKHLPASPKGYYEAKDVTEGTDRFVAYRKLDDFPLIVTVSKLKSKVLNAWQKQAVISLMFVLFTSVLLGYFLWIIRRQANALEGHEANLCQQVEREKEYNVLQQKFVSLVSHEFRTPLTIIDGAAQRLIRRKDKLNSGEVETRANRVRSAVTRMIGLIDTTLYASRLDAGKIGMKIASCDIGELLMDICERQSEISPSHQIEVMIDDLPDEILADPTLLDQVFTNLLSNAVKYAPDAPNIEVKGWSDGDKALVTITDQGLGIPEKDLPHMFGRFFRAGTAEGIKGTGIGLNVVKEFAEMHGGSVGVDSIEGEGSTFTVRLPIDGAGQ